MLLGVLLLVVLVEGEPSGAHGGDGSHLLLDPVAVLVLRVLLGLVLLMLQSHRNTSMHTRSRAESCIDQAINKEVGFCSHQSICAGSNGAELAELLHVLVVLLLLLVVDLAGALLLLALVEQVVVVLLLSHGSSNVSP